MKYAAERPFADPEMAAPAGLSRYGGRRLIAYWPPS